MTTVHQTDPPLTTPSATTPLDRQIVLTGCHGGAGTTTLARMMTGVIASGQELEVPDDAVLLLVTRGTPHGTHRASQVLEQARQQGLAPAALAVVGDGPWPEPRLATLRLRMLDGLIPAVVRVPYVSRWRYVSDPLEQPLPAKITRAVRDLDALVSTHHSRR